MPLTRVGTTNVYAGVAELANGTGFSWHYEVGARRFGGGQLEAYETHPDSKEQAGVPKGTLKQMPPSESTIFPGTKRDWCYRSNSLELGDITTMNTLQVSILCSIVGHQRSLGTDFVSSIHTANPLSRSKPRRWRTKRMSCLL